LANINATTRVRDRASAHPYDPTLRHVDVPERIDIVLVNGDPNPDRPDLPPYGAGEAALKPTLAAIGNAIYDATGVRIRRVPFRNDRVLAALKAAGV
jgi:CO/xanthine dehydrogenase Mo-binding subunit